MSSPLDARMRRIAREELHAGGAPAVADSTDRVAALEKEVAELRADLKQVAGLLNRLTPAAAPDVQDEKPTTRRTRKTASTE